MSDPPTLLLTGATGFVGRHLRIALEAAGWRCRLGTRSPDRARETDPTGEWAVCDLERPETVRAALEGCRAAVFLVHGLGSGGDYPERERSSAEAFARAGEAAGLERIVYLGGVVPVGESSRHLESRQRTGAILRAGTVPTIELRAAAVVGHGSASWQMMRDLAARLPAMVLPRWVDHTSWPVAIDDVVAALVAALGSVPATAGCYDLPGPERLTHRDLLRRVARCLGRHPLFVGVPVLTPRLSSYWVGLVTSVDYGVAKELIAGLTTDLEPSCPDFRDHPALGATPLPLTPLDAAMAEALAEAAADDSPSDQRRATLAAIGRRFALAEA